MENKTWTYADRYRHIKEVKSAIRKKSGFSRADL